MASSTSSTSEMAEKYGIDTRLLDQPIQQYIASTLVANQFLHFCHRCGEAITIRPNKKRSNPRFCKFEYLQPDVEHVCRWTKEQRLRHLNKVNI